MQRLYAYRGRAARAAISYSAFMTRPDALDSLRRLAAGSPLFDDRTGAGAPLIFARAHGCLDVLGALEAEGGGTLAQMVLPGTIAVAMQRRTAGELRMRSLQMAPPLGVPEACFPLAELSQRSPEQAAEFFIAAAATPSGWAAAGLALLYLLHRDIAPGTPPAGVHVLINGELPMGAGQASSTAVLAAMARGLIQLHHLQLDPQAIANWMASAEALAGITHLPVPPPSRAHIIDALTCLQERRPREHPPARGELLRYSAQPNRFVGVVPLPEEVRVFALDTGVRYHSTRATLEELRIAAAMGHRIIETVYRDLGQPHTPLHGYLTNTSPLLYRQYFRTLLPKRLRGNDFLRTYGSLPAGGERLLSYASEEIDAVRLYRVRTAVDHVIAENEHAEQFLQAMEELAEASAAGPASRGERGAIDAAERQRTLARAGRLLLASHHSYRLRLELSCREADCLVDALMEAGPEKGVYGARITGCGGGGTVIALLNRSEAATDALLGAIRSYHQMTGLTLGVVEV
jgi:L-arabinokinase